MTFYYWVLSLYLAFLIGTLYQARKHFKDSDVEVLVLRAETAKLKALMKLHGIIVPNTKSNARGE